MVRAHLGIMERDLDNIARHFDKYPNFAIDTAARMRYLMLMPPNEVRAFSSSIRIVSSTAPISICSRTRFRLDHNELDR